MGDGVLSPMISKRDAIVSSASVVRLRSCFAGDDHSLVFFVGAGASTAGNTQMPTTRALLQQILLDALDCSGEFDAKSNELVEAIGEISNHIGLEITLNDFWQICGKVTTLLYASFAELELRCASNCVHVFLAYWLSRGGIVLTTNWDRLIEREWLKRDHDIEVRYQEEGSDSFGTWREDLDRGGCLFKLHGSLDNPGSCLGALQHVGTRLVGDRASLLGEIVQRRPLCFVGWQGVDPDIPPLLSELYKRRDPLLPVFWMHYEGALPGAVSLQTAIDHTPPALREPACAHPILTDANRTFEKALGWVGLEAPAGPSPVAAHLDFSEAVRHCSASGASRFAGIAARRAGNLTLARHILETAMGVAHTPEERSAAEQELALLQQQETGKETVQARKLLEEARKSLGDKPDPWLQLNTDFGMLSMTVVGLGSRPWLVLKLPRLFRQYRQSIELLRRGTTDAESVALHESLLNLYLGRLRLMLLGWLAISMAPVADWILRPFSVARSTIDGAKDTHLHSRIDVLAYRAVALARLRRYQNAMEDVPEIGRLISVLKDDARETYWEHQRTEIESRCGNGA